MVRPKRAPNNIKKAANVGSHSNTTADLNLNDEDSLKKSNRTQKSDEDDDVPCKAKASRKPPKDKTDKTELVKEPRKRRMASLNAEFLVHYCTNTNNASQQAHEKRASESPSSSKRRRTVSNESKAKKGRPNTRTRKKKADSDHQEEEEEEKQPVKTRKSQKRRGRHKTVKVDNRSDSSVSRAEPLAPPVSSGRPKREASLRASAMIIQTNEIEKTRFQYYPSVGSANAAPPPPPPVTPAANSLTVSKSKADKSHFQVPNPPKALKNAKNKSDANLKHVSTATTLANSQAAIMGRNESPDDEESSSDVLIVSEKNSNGEFVLTEERLADHNKLYGSYSTGNGTFSTHTKDYINKWIGGLETAEDKPFPQEIIPIDSFGSKVLNDPQYLTVKSRQQPTQSKSVKSTVGQQTKAKETVQPVKPALQTNQTTKNEQKQNGKASLDIVCLKSDTITNGFELKAKQVIASS